MKKISYAGRFGFLALVIAGLVFPVSAQVSLRNALDFDGDGSADHFLWRPGANTWLIRSSGGPSFFHQFGDESSMDEAPGDYDGDGKGDIATFDDSTATWSRIESSTGAVVTQVFGQPNDFPVQRDYDGDGKTDLAVVRPVGGDLIWEVLRSSNGVPTTLGGACGFQDTDFEAPGDYDGDGLFDAAVQRLNPGPQTSTFIICCSSGGTQSIPWGTDLDFNNIADYDGDGKSDIAVTTAGVGGALVWNIRRSSDSTQMSIPWGLITEDDPVQNDYNGDGRAEIAVYRRDEARFYVLDPINGGVNLVPWGRPDDYPLANYFSN